MFAYTDRQRHTSPENLLMKSMSGPTLKQNGSVDAIECLKLTNQLESLETQNSSDATTERTTSSPSASDEPMENA